MYIRHNIQTIEDLPYNWTQKILEIWRHHPSSIETPYQASKRLVGRSPVNPIFRDVVNNVNVSVYQGGWVITDYSNEDGTRGGAVGVLIKEAEQ